MDPVEQRQYYAVEMRDTPEEEPLLMRYWQAVLRHKKVIAALLVGSLLFGILITMLIEPKFTAVAQIEISREEQNVANVEGVEPAEAGQAAEFYQTQYGLLRAKSLALRVARRLNLTANPEFYEAFDSEILADGSEPVSLETRQRIASSILLRNVEIAPIRGSGLVDISFRSPDPVLSERVANAWAEEFIAANQDRRFESSSGARDFLERRLAELRGRLEDSERKLVAYARNREIVNISAERNGEGQSVGERSLISAELEALNDALSQATARRIAASGATGGGVSPNSLANPTLNSLRSQKAELEAEYAKLMSQFEPGYPAARALRSQIDQIQKSIVAEESRVRQSSQTAYQQALREEEGLQAKVNSIKERLLGQQSDRIQYNIYQRDADTNRQLYDALLQRYKEIGVAGVGTSSIAIVDQAELPTSPSSPNLALNIILALFAGTILSGLAVIALEQLDQTVKDPKDIYSLLQIPLIGVIPDAEGEPLQELADPKSPLSEAYASVRATLALSTKHGIPRSMMFTSTRQAEGKSTSSIATAQVLAKLGRKVALIDGDMRNPSVHRWFGWKNDGGLSTYLAGDDDFASLSHVDGNGVTVMTGGALPPNPSDLLSSERMTKLMDLLDGQFDTVIIDAPPVLGISDALLLSQHVEGVAYVIEAGGAKLGSIEASISRLRQAGAHLFGAVVTKLETSNSEYAYQYAYGGKGES